MASMTLKDSEIKAILAEVHASLTEAKKSEVAKLSKAVDGAHEEPDGDEPQASSPEASDSAPAPESSEGAGGPPAGDVPPPDASASPDAGAPASATMDGSAPPDASADGSADPAAQQGPVDPAQLSQEYSALDDESLKAHYMACKQAVFARMEQSQGAPGAEAGAPPAEASAGGPPPAAEGSVPPPAMKAEGKPEMGNVVPVTSIDQGQKETQQNNGPGADLSATNHEPSPATAADPGPGAPKADHGLGKSEREAQLEAALETLAGLVLHTTKPKQLATTSLQELERRELLAKGEKAAAVKPVDAGDKKAVQAKLSELVREQKLSKSDKEKVMKYYVKGDFALVKHLFN